jgi:hypothetical protein
MPSPPDLKIHFSEADLDALTKKLPVHLGGDDGKTSSRTLITPQGKFLWGLSKELEERVLELEKRVEEVRGVGRWRPRNASGRKPAADTQGALGGRKAKRGGGGGSNGGDFRTDVLPAIATALKEAGAKLGKQQQQASTTSTSGSGSGADAGSSACAAATTAKSAAAQKHHMSFDDALGYLNQWVLPATDPASSGGLPSAHHHHHHHHHHQPQQPSVGPPPSSTSTASLLSAAKLAAGSGSGAATALPIPDLENLGVFAAEVLGGYVVQGLEALVGVGAGVGGTTFGPASTGTGTGTGAGGEGGGGGGRGGGGAGGVLGVEEAEQAMLQSRREAEQLEKKVNALVKRNRRVLSGAVGGGKLGLGVRLVDLEEGERMRG